MEPSKALQALLQERVFPSPHLEAVVAARLSAAEELASSASSLRPDRLAGKLLPLLRALASTLQRVETEAMEQHVLASSSGNDATSVRHAAPLYLSLLEAIARLAGIPACGAALEAEQAGIQHGARPTTVQHCIELLLAQMMSAGIRAMAEGGDADAILEAPRCGLWAAAKALLRAAPNAGLTALLSLSSTRGSCLLVSTRLTNDNRSMQAATNRLLGAALEFVSSQASLLVGCLKPELLAVPMNARLTSLTADDASDSEWHMMWAPVMHGLQAVAVELVRIGGPPLYGSWRTCLLPYDTASRPALLEAMQAEWQRMREQRQQEPLEDRLHCILLKCGFLDTEQAGLVELHDFMVEHGAMVSLFCAQAGVEGTPYGRMVAGFVSAAVHARESRQPAAGGAGSRPAASVTVAEPAASARAPLARAEPLAPMSSNVRAPAAPSSSSDSTAKTPSPGGRLDAKPACTRGPEQDAGQAASNTAEPAAPSPRHSSQATAASSHLPRPGQQQAGASQRAKTRLPSSR